MTPLIYACSRGKVRESKIALRLIEVGTNISCTRQMNGMNVLKFFTCNCKPEVIEVSANVDGFPKTA